MPVICWAAWALVFLVFCWVAWSDLSTLIGRIVSDDMYYHLSVRAPVAAIDAEGQ